MNIFEAMYKGKGKVILPETPKGNYCYFYRNYFVWEKDSLVKIRDSYIVSDIDLIRSDWEIYTEEIKKCSCQDCINNLGDYIKVDKNSICIECGRKAMTPFVKVDNAYNDNLSIIAAIQALEEVKKCLSFRTKN